ncbi:MAG TPA: N-acetyltransferase [Burkholderiales bacterium]|nr:N-acetyltransferase [Burkholderiales bacterium]
MPLPVIREERPEDVERVRSVHLAAFGREREARLVERLRAAGKAAVSLLAEENGAVLGHVMFSAVSIDTDDRARGAWALAPLAVLPAFRRLGIGSALVSAGLARLRERGESRVLVLGDPHYYSRFGFVPAARFGLQCPFPAPEEAFMAIELEPGALSGCAGTACYGHEFDDLE